MRGLVFFLSLLNGYRWQLYVFGVTQPGLNLDHFSNYSYGTFHFYNYEYKKPIPPNGDYVQSDNFHFNLPNANQGEFSRQNVPLTQPVQQRSNFNNNNNNNNFPRNTPNTPNMQNDQKYLSSNLPSFIEQHQSDANLPRISRQDFSRAKTDKTPYLTVNGSNCAYGFCEHAENYPDQLLLKLVKGDQSLSAFFKLKVPQIGERFLADFENICEVTKKTLSPKTAQNVDKKNRIVVNLKEYQQIVETEVCSETASCKFENYWPDGYQGKCIQKYVEVPLAVMDEMDSKIIIEKFSYPYGCYCACKSN